MLTKPDIKDKLIISCLQDEYDLRVASLTFLPLGADMGTAVYRVVADGGRVYFLKLRKGFDEISVTVPLFLKSQGMGAIVAPFKTKSTLGWADFQEYTMMLYPFIEGKDGFDRQLSDHHKQMLGAALRAIHSSHIPPELKQRIPQETFSPQYRTDMELFQAQVESRIFEEPVAAKLAEFIRSKRNEIRHLIERARELASELQATPLEFVLCHTDIHAGNMLIGDDGGFYIVDWDAPLLAPKERDLLFIGGGIDQIWRTQQDESLFYDGYGKKDIHLAALAYFRYERIIVDLVEFCRQLLLTREGGADREQAYQWFTSNFAVGGTLEIAQQTDIETRS